MPSTVKKIPFKSLEVIRLRTVTLGTFGLGGAAVDATHDGGFGFFFGGIAVCLQSAMYNPSTDRYSGTEQEPPPASHKSSKTQGREGSTAPASHK